MKQWGQPVNPPVEEITLQQLVRILTLRERFKISEDTSPHQSKGGGDGRPNGASQRAYKTPAGVY